MWKMNKDPLEWTITFGKKNPHKHFKLDKDTENQQTQFAFLHQNHLHFHDKDGH